MLNLYDSEVGKKINLIELSPFPYLIWPAHTVDLRSLLKIRNDPNSTQLRSHITLDKTNSTCNKPKNTKNHTPLSLMGPVSMTENQAKQNATRPPSVSVLSPTYPIPVKATSLLLSSP
ncbi:hypothetical protein L6164_024872 [Bauhinia variegata]|uniref:Uncharacterized protein n=1 Tax=Bauhinia variegata TaxID=167791 RepID=A0ACB9LYL4_BAUVA|nr:hypothetical protein L6164_024872 [Bauhinia variegata]